MQIDSFVMYSQSAFIGIIKSESLSGMANASNLI